MGDDEEEEEETQPKKSAKKTKTANTPFQRVDPNEKFSLMKSMQDNSFDQTRIGGGNTWGEKAHRDLIVTRGKGFRHEKTKKKRGTYRGGKLSMEIRSIKFN